MVLLESDFVDEMEKFSFAGFCALGAIVCICIVIGNRAR